LPLKVKYEVKYPRSFERKISFFTSAWFAQGPLPFGIAFEDQKTHMARGVPWFGEEAVLPGESVFLAPQE
jgi:hypothetical protein